MSVNNLVGWLAKLLSGILNRGMWILLSQTPAAIGTVLGSLASRASLPSHENGLIYTVHTIILYARRHFPIGLLMSRLGTLGKYALH